MYNHPDGRAIMFEGPTYSKRKIVEFITVLDGFEQVLKIIQLFEGIFFLFQNFLLILDKFF